MRSHWRNAVVLFASFLLTAAAIAGAPNGGILRVDDDAPPGGDGLTWDTAYRFLQDALANASGGGISEIRVAQGTYKPDEDEANPDGTGNRLATYQLINNVPLVGGFAGLSADNPDDQDADLYGTYLSGDLNGDGKTNDDNSEHVVTVSGAGGTYVIRGMRIVRGLANGSVRRGAGIRTGNSNLVLQECLLADNIAFEGGGLSSVGGNISLIGCTTSSNRTVQLGGGLYLVNSDVEIVDCLFEKNLPTQGSVPGGGIYALDSDLLLNASSFVNNEAESGGGIYFDGDTSTLSVTGCEFMNNSCQNGSGGAMYHWSGDATVIDSTFNGNQCGQNGGSIYQHHDGVLSVTGSTFTNHACSDSGGAIFTSQLSNATITNSDFTNNASGEGQSDGGGAISLASGVIEGCSFIDNNSRSGGGIEFDSSVGFGTLSNCVFSGNQANRGGGIFIAGGSFGPYLVTGCTIESNSGQFNLFGAGIFIENQNSFTTIVNSYIRGNAAILRGGALLAEGGILNIVNCEVSANRSILEEGGGILLLGTEAFLINTTIVDNHALAGIGGGLAFFPGSEGSVKVANSILWANSDTEGDGESAQIRIEGGPAVVDYSCIQGLTGSLGGVGNIAENPLFVDPSDDDYRLSPDSPVIDAADNTAVPEGVVTDLDGNPRFVDDPNTRDTGNGDPPIVDMGAYEFQGTGIIEASLDIKPGACPNSFNRNSHGMLPAAILGSDDFDAAQIDIASITLLRADGIGGSVAPNEGPLGPHSVLDDVGTPFGGEPCDCHALGGDGLIDLVMHFSSTELVEALELNDLPADAQVPLIVTGELIDGSPFTATDCIRLVPIGDMNGDGDVGSLDLIILLDSFGSCAECVDCPMDLDGDCTIGAGDLLVLLANWG